MRPANTKCASSFTRVRGSFRRLMFMSGVVEFDVVNRPLDTLKVALFAITGVQRSDYACVCAGVFSCV